MAGKNDVADGLRQMITDGEAKPGQSVGSIEQAATQYGASVGATRLAFQELVKQGYLVARGRAGHFVAATIPDPPAAVLNRRLPIERLEAVEQTQAEILERLAALEKRQRK